MKIKFKTKNIKILLSVITSFAIPLSSLPIKSKALNEKIATEISNKILNSRDNKYEILCDMSLFIQNSPNEEKIEYLNKFFECCNVVCKKAAFSDTDSKRMCELFEPIMEALKYISQMECMSSDMLEVYFLEYIKSMKIVQVDANNVKEYVSFVLNNNFSGETKKEFISLIFRNCKRENINNLDKIKNLTSLKRVLQKNIFAFSNSIDEEISKLVKAFKNKNINSILNSKFLKIEKIERLKKLVSMNLRDENTEELKLSVNEIIKDLSNSIYEQDIVEFLVKKYKENKRVISFDYNSFWSLIHVHNLLKNSKMDLNIVDEKIIYLLSHLNKNESFAIPDALEEAVGSNAHCYDFQFLKESKCGDLESYKFHFHYDPSCFSYLQPHECVFNSFSEKEDEPVKKQMSRIREMRALADDQKKGDQSDNILRINEARILFLENLEKDFECNLNEAFKKNIQCQKRSFIDMNFFILSVNMNCFEEYKPTEFLEEQEKIVSYSDIFEQINDKNVSAEKVMGSLNSYLEKFKDNNGKLFNCMRYFFESFEKLLKNENYDVRELQKRLKELFGVFSKVNEKGLSINSEEFLNQKDLDIILEYLQRMDKIEGDDAQPTADFKSALEKMPQKFRKIEDFFGISKITVLDLEDEFKRLIIFSSKAHSAKSKGNVTIQNFNDFVDCKLKESGYCYSSNPRIARFFYLKNMSQILDKDSLFIIIVNRELNSFEIKDQDIEDFIQNFLDTKEDSIGKVFSLLKLAKRYEDTPIISNKILEKIANFDIPIEDIENYLKSKAANVTKTMCDLKERFPNCKAIENYFEVFEQKQKFKNFLIDKTDFDEKSLLDLSLFFVDFMRDEAKLEKKQNENLFINLIRYVKSKKNDEIVKVKISEIIEQDKKNENFFLGVLKFLLRNEFGIKDNYFNNVKNLKALDSKEKIRTLEFVRQMFLEYKDKKFLDLYLKLQEDSDQKIALVNTLIENDDDKLFENVKQILNLKFDNLLDTKTFIENENTRQRFLERVLIPLVNRENFVNFSNAEKYTDILTDLFSNVSPDFKILDPLLKFGNRKVLNQIFELYFSKNDLNLENYNNLLTDNSKEALDDFVEKKLASKQHKDVQESINLIMKIGKRNPLKKEDASFLYDNFLSEDKTDFLKERKNRDNIKNIFKSSVFSSFGKSSKHFLQDKIDESNGELFFSFDLYCEALKKRFQNDPKSISKDEYKLVEDCLEILKKAKKESIKKCYGFFENLGCIYESKVNLENRNELLKKFNISSENLDDYVEDPFGFLKHLKCTFSEESIKKMRLEFCKDKNHITIGEHSLNSDHVLGFFNLGLNLFCTKDRKILYKIITTGSKNMKLFLSDSSSDDYIIDIPVGEILKNTTIRTCWGKNGKIDYFKTAFLFAK